jgi:hypothetical protein
VLSVIVSVVYYICSGTSLASFLVLRIHVSWARACYETRHPGTSLSAVVVADMAVTMVLILV